MARMHVQSWQETYRGLMAGEVLDDPEFITTRETFWTAALCDERYARNRTAVALQNCRVIGIAMSGPPQDADASWAVQLYVLYLLKAHQGSGVARMLLEAVLAPEESAGSWVADQNPRGQAFYRKHGFRPDQASESHAGLRAIRMVRHPLAQPV
ncbi:N-acetyltransferase [Cryobacterium frigoriphilum]|uniref:N-acetyltransferase n=1 Tax=Cryobacterium frigoriphilum TaxID=1259150 RepID=A0A4R9A5E0_9MICO|nr:N-acetyltransferase [Cryobacterium frigoriphilum]